MAPVQRKEIKIRLTKILKWAKRLIKKINCLLIFLTPLALVFTSLGFYFDVQNTEDAKMNSALKVLGMGKEKVKAMEFLNSQEIRFDYVDISGRNEQPLVFLKDLNLESAKIDNSNFSRTNLYGAKFTKSTIHRTLFTDAVIHWGDFSSSRVMNSTFDNAQMLQASFEESSLPNSTFIGADIRRGKFTRSNLLDVDFTGAQLARANFSDANLHGTNLSYAGLWQVDLRGVKNFTCDQLTKAKFWKMSFRDEPLKCGAFIPKKDDAKQIYQSEEFAFKNYAPEGFLGFYSGRSCEKIEIGHVVSLKEAYRLGAKMWSDKDKETFANDKENHVSVCASVNRIKGSSSPQQFFQEIKNIRGKGMIIKNHCAYLEAHYFVAVKYHLASSLIDFVPLLLECNFKPENLHKNFRW